MRACDRCGEEFSIGSLAKIRGKYYCKGRGKGNNCLREIRLEHRKETFESLDEEEKNKIIELDKKLTKEDNEKRYDKIRVKPKGSGPGRIKKIIDVGLIPKIKGQKKKRSKGNGGVLYMTIQEKQLLYRKYVKNGASHEEAAEYVADTTDHLRELRKELKCKGKTDKDIKKRIMEEFEKICNQ